MLLFRKVSFVNMVIQRTHGNNISVYTATLHRLDYIKRIVVRRSEVAYLSPGEMALVLDREICAPLVGIIHYSVCSTMHTQGGLPVVSL